MTLFLKIMSKLIYKVVPRIIEHESPLLFIEMIKQANV